MRLAGVFVAGPPAVGRSRCWAAVNVCTRSVKNTGRVGELSILKI